MKTLHAELQLMRQIFSQRALARGRVVGRADAGEKQQVIVAERLGRQDHQVGGLKNFFAGFVDVRDAARPPALVPFSCTMRRTVMPVRRDTLLRFCTTGR